MKRNDILLILVPLFIFAILWIGFSIYHNIITSTISVPLSVQIEPITPNFDTGVIDSLKNREKVSPIYELSVPVQNVTVPASPSASPVIVTPTPVPSGNSTSNLQATTEGSLTP
ncbi:MAG: hypothetical protein ABSE17_00145 [Candidatus Levyibacteriota bacterium]|jgi:hypothetical protein